MNRFLASFSLLAVFGIGVLHDFQKETVQEEMDPNEFTMEEAIALLGGENVAHKMEAVDYTKAELGRQLIFTGQTKRGVFKSKVISPYFKCIDCHNVKNEFMDARNNKAENRLEHAINQNLPFLPASTLWGIYNRKAFYNGDYTKKYGEVISEAKASLPEAIQVCAEYCSAGRKLKNWELDAIMHYFKSKELKLKDLPIDGNTKKNILNVGKLTEKEKTKFLQILETCIVKAYPATFMETMPRDERRYGENADAENGREIFNRSCMHCHENGRVTNLKLGRDVLTGRMFEKHLTDYTDLSLYQIVRHGTYTMPGRNQYMPLYTKEKMSDEQLENLVAYLKTLANK
jgi:mono/diheme cytochrome c family protein